MFIFSPMHEIPYMFFRLQDNFVAGAAMADLLADARAAGDGGDSFLYSFGDKLTVTSNTPKIYLVAQHGQVIVGMLILVTDAAATLPGVAQISAIITRPSHRRKGIATQLLRLAGELAAENDKRVLTLETAAGDHAAGFFTQAGFAINSTEPGFSSMPDGRVVDTVIYWKRAGS